MSHTAGHTDYAGLLEPMILEHVQVGVIFVDRQDTVRYANGKACALLNVGFHDVLEHDVPSLRPEPLRDRIAEAIRTFRDDRKAPPLTFHSSVSDRGLVLQCVPVGGAHSDYGGVVITLTDVTDRVRALEGRFEAEKTETIRKLTGGIAHGFNNLMAIVLGLASYMKARRAQDHPDHANLRQIEEAAATAGRLAHQLLAVVRGGSFFSRPVGGADLMALVHSRIQRLIPGSVQLDCHADGDLWQISCDPAQIEQVIMTFYDNAVEAMPAGGCLMIEARNAVVDAPPNNAYPALAAGEYVRISVQDTGCGMDAKTLRQVFQPFFTTKPGGYGLSLAAAYSIMRGHNGAIAVDSERGHGATFTIWLPRAVSS